MGQTPRTERQPQTVFADAHVVLREVADGREELRYGPVLLGWVDRTTGETRFERY